MCAPECVSCFLPRPVEPPVEAPTKQGHRCPWEGLEPPQWVVTRRPVGRAGRQQVARRGGRLSCPGQSSGAARAFARVGHTAGCPLGGVLAISPCAGQFHVGRGQAGWSCRPPPPPARASLAAAGGPWAPCASSPGAALSSAGFAEHLLTYPCLTLLLSLAHQPEASLRGAEAGRKGPRSDGGLGWRPSCQSHPRGAAFHGTWPHTRVAIVCCWNFVLISTGSRSSPHICWASRRWGQVRRLRS